MANKITQTKDDLQEHLKEQLQFLENAGESYDNGDIKQSKLIAVHLRVLLHDTTSSHSLLGQLNIKDSTLFYDSASEHSDVTQTYTGLVLKGVGPSGAKYVPPLDDLPYNQKYRKVNFDEYWNRVIFKYDRNKVLTRKDLVLAVANQDGGAHVGNELDEWYADLIKNNSIGWIYGNGDEDDPKPIENPSLSAIRQIGHEVLKTLIPNYPEKKKLHLNKEMIMVGEIFLEKGFQPGFMLAPALTDKIGRNDLCPCGSGKKWKKCGYLETKEHTDLYKDLFDN